MAKYRKKPVEIEAFQYTGDVKNGSEYCIPDWAIEAFESRKMYYRLREYGRHSPEFITRDDIVYGLYIDTLEGQMLVNTGDYVIKGVKGELYPCKPDIFEQTYEKVLNKEQIQNLETHPTEALVIRFSEAASLKDNYELYLQVKKEFPGKKVIGLPAKAKLESCSKDVLENYISMITDVIEKL